MRRFVLVFLLGCSAGLWAQTPSRSSDSSPANSQAPDSGSSSANKPAKPGTPDLSPPQSGRINASELSDEPGQSTSKATQVDLSPPPDDAKDHPKSSEMLMDEEAASGSGDVNEVHLFNPHKAAKDVEVGDFYFKRKNYRAAEDRYREALQYKDNDAVATFRLAVCLEKLEQPEDANREYENYLKILPHGPEAGEATKAIDRLKSTAAKSTK